MNSPSPIVAAESFSTAQAVDPFEYIKKCMCYDWDGRGSPAITITTMRQAKRVHKMLQDSDQYGAEIIPGPNATVRFKWVYDRKEGDKRVIRLDLDIGPGKRASSARRYGNGKIVRTQYTQFDLEDIAPLFTRDDEDSNLVSYAKRELEIAGYFGEDSDYGGMLGNAVLELMRTFSKQGHSGMSAAITRELFNTVSQFKPLGDFYPTIKDSMDVDGKGLLQSTRKSSVFSKDGGKTWYDLDDPDYNYTNYNYPEN